MSFCICVSAFMVVCTRVCACAPVWVWVHHIPEILLPLICGVLSSRENRPLPPLPLSSQWGGWCGTTWAREWLEALSVI